MTLDLFSVNAAELAQVDLRVGLIWRILVQAAVPTTTAEILSEARDRGHLISAGGSVNRLLRSLQDSGWIEMTETTRSFGGAVRRVPAWVAYKERDLSKVPGESARSPFIRTRHAQAQRIFNARKKMTELVELAHKARYSAIAVEMGAALFTIERELREVRDSISRHGVHQKKGRS